MIMNPGTVKKKTDSYLDRQVGEQDYFFLMIVKRSNFSHMSRCTFDCAEERVSQFQDEQISQRLEGHSSHGITTQTAMTRSCSVCSRLTFPKRVFELKGAPSLCLFVCCSLHALPVSSAWLPSYLLCT